MYKKLLSCLLAITMTVTSAPIVIADDPWDDNAGGGGSTGDVGGGTLKLLNSAMS